MHLPDDFPHTRYERYVLVMPERLLTAQEQMTRRRVLERFRRYTARLVQPFLAKARSRGLTTEEFAKEFVARFEGSLPAVFRR